MDDDRPQRFLTALRWRPGVSRRGMVFEPKDASYPMSRWSRVICGLMIGANAQGRLVVVEPPGGESGWCAARAGASHESCVERLSDEQLEAAVAGWRDDQLN
jgi:hypothetical protein